MAELWFQVFPKNQADRDILVRGLRGAVHLENIKGYETMLRGDPDNAAMHDDVALLYAQAGNYAKVAAHFAETARIKPDSAVARYNMGLALLNQGNAEDAGLHFQRALQMDPSYENAHRGLAIVLQRAGKIDEAAVSYRRAIQLAPDDMVAHHNLGVLLQGQGKFDEALTEYGEAVRVNAGDYEAHYAMGILLRFQGKLADAIAHDREALRSAPDRPALLIELSWVLATAPDPTVRLPEEAVRLAERAAQVTRPQTFAVLDVLAAALAAAGRFDEAVSSAQNALALATTAKDESATAQIRARLALYQKRQPFREAR